jgi:hypothetical protein
MQRRRPPCPANAGSRAWVQDAKAGGDRDGTGARWSAQGFTSGHGVGAYSRRSGLWGRDVGPSG